MKNSSLHQVQQMGPLTELLNSPMVCSSPRLSQEARSVAKRSLAQAVATNPPQQQTVQDLGRAPTQERSYMTSFRASMESRQATVAPSRTRRRGDQNQRHGYCQVRNSRGARHSLESPGCKAFESPASFSFQPLLQVQGSIASARHGRQAPSWHATGAIENRCPDLCGSSASMSGRQR